MRVCFWASDQLILISIFFAVVPLLISSNRGSAARRSYSFPSPHTLLHFHFNLFWVLSFFVCFSHLMNVGSSQPWASISIVLSPYLSLLLRFLFVFLLFLCDSREEDLEKNKSELLLWFPGCCFFLLLLVILFWLHATARRPFTPLPNASNASSLSFSVTLTSTECRVSYFFFFFLLQLVWTTRPCPLCDVRKGKNKNKIESRLLCAAMFSDVFRHLYILLFLPSIFLSLSISSSSFN